MKSQMEPEKRKTGAIANNFDDMIAESDKFVNNTVLLSYNFLDMSK